MTAAPRELADLHEHWTREIDERDRRRRLHLWLAELEEAFLEVARAELTEVEALIETNQEREAA